VYFLALAQQPAMFHGEVEEALRHVPATVMALWKNNDRPVKAVRKISITG